jgi:phosphoglycerol transferase MdoB-like AlkP superfamily enzyme
VQFAHVVLTVALVSLAAVCAAESITRGGPGECWRWIHKRALIFLLNLALVAGTILLVVCLTGRLAFTCTVMAGLVVLGAEASRVKYKTISEPLLCTDLLMVRQAWALAPQLVGWRHLTGFGSAAVALIAAWWADGRWIDAATAPLSGQWVSAVCAAAVPLLAVMVAPGGVRRVLFGPPREGDAARGHQYRYRKGGFAIGFFVSARETVRMPEPAGYSCEAIAELVKTCDPAEAARPAGEAVPPHIVALMVESLFDVTLLPRCTFSQDPMAQLHRLREKYGRYELLSPGYGGKTANVEFELLTGLCNGLFPEGFYPYYHGVVRPIPSVPRALGAFGYQSSVIHPYLRWFWSRPKVYGHMGIGRFDALESFEGAEVRGDYVSDAACVERMIEGLTRAGTSSPQFMLGITMQNHGPYHKRQYAHYDVDVQAPASLSASEQLELRNYAQGVYDADQAIARLVAFVESSPMPIVLAVFGDHLPGFNSGLAMYHRLGLIEDPQASLAGDLVRLRTTPLLLVSNVRGALRPESGPVEPNLLIPDLLRMAGVDHPYYVRLLSQLRRHARGMLGNVSVLANQQAIEGVPPELAPLWRGYEQMQYDLLYGEGYSRELFAREGWRPKR